MSDGEARKPAPPAGEAVRWAAVVLAASALILALCNAESARNWAEGLPPSPAGHAVRSACETWAEVTEGLGLARPRAWARHGWRALHDLTWRPAARRRAEGR